MSASWGGGGGGGGATRTMRHAAYCAAFVSACLILY